ncbi:beta-propeller fold lactonase family protein [Candidatus Babeliales bacterium]|nr:beta-propeller fold lactonase family protein [Candidatus Babeliales bacterium]
MKSGKLFLLVIFLLFGQALRATSLTGTVTQVYQDKHYVFRNFNTAKGYVRLNNGFTILAGQSAGLDTFVTVSGAIDLRTTGSLDLRGDLFLDAHVTWSSSGKIYGRGNAIHLGGSLSLPTDTIVQFIDDTIIDGHGNTLTLGAHAQLLLASDVSLTLKNMTIETTRNSSHIPIIRCFDQKGHVTLDNIELALTDDFAFRTGRMFFNNDVIVTGTSCFIYQSWMQSYVAPQSLLTLDPGTTFYYYPSSAREDLVQLVEKSSGIFLKGSATTLQVTHTGMRLSTGRLWLDNKVTLSTRALTALDLVTQVTSANYGFCPYSVDISPNGRYLAVTGQIPNNGNEVQIFKFSGTILTLIASANTPGEGYQIRWSPDGRYVANIGGGGIRVYSFDGTNLVQTASATLTLANAFSVAWSPDGRYIAAGANNTTDELSIFRFSAGTITLLDSLDLGAAVDVAPVTISWHPQGAVFVVGTNNTVSGGNEVRLYSFNGSSLSLLTSVSVTTAGAVQYAEFSPDGDFLAVATTVPAVGHTELEVYTFNGSTLTRVAGVSTTTLQEIAWSPDGQYIVTAFGNIYRFTSTTLTAVATGVISANTGVRWSRDGKFLVASGGTRDVDVYSVAYRFDTRTQALTNGISLGNSTAGSSFDLDTYVLSGATVNLAGQLFYDSTS